MSTLPYMQLIRWHYARANQKTMLATKDHKQSADQIQNAPTAVIGKGLRPHHAGRDVGNPTPLS